MSLEVGALQGLRGWLSTAEELLDGVAHGGVDLAKVSAADGCRARGACGADDALAEVLGLHVGFGQLPVATEPLDLQVLGVQAVTGISLCLLRLLPAPLQRKGNAHCAVESEIIFPGRDRGAPAFHNEAGVLVCPPMPLLLVKGALYAQLEGRSVLQSLEPLRQPRLQGFWRTQDLFQNIIELIYGHHDNPSGARPVAELEHHVIALADAQSGGDLLLEVPRVATREASLQGHQVLVARELHEVMGELLVR
mmetsp:Transcript_31833/g.86272  ORF Transcript_31833/g.86272 Transcript_31833/m.86272 type:complete len:251 (-) Transcript_31833:375-1127(-)